MIILKNQLLLMINYGMGHIGAVDLDMHCPGFQAQVIKANDDALPLSTARFIDMDTGEFSPEKQLQCLIRE